MFTMLVPMSEESVGGISVVLPPLYEIFWSALILLIILLVVGRYALPRIYSMIDERREAIQEGLEAAEKARLMCLLKNLARNSPASLSNLEIGSLKFCGFCGGFGNRCRGITCEIWGWGNCWGFTK